MTKVLPLFIALSLFFFLRLINLFIRQSDTNIYFYTATELLQGKVLYKDIFFTNLPVFPYISALYLFISDQNILWYYFTPTIEVSMTTLLIYYLVIKKTKDYLSALCSSFLYLFSFIVLSTSDHQTGVFLASLISVIAYFFWDKKQYVVSGIFLGFCIMIKAYFLPIVLSFFIAALCLKNYKALFLSSSSFIITCILILIPFLLLAPQEIYTDIVTYSLTRLQGVSKIDIFWFFVTKDFILFLLLIFNLAMIRKNVLFGCISIFSILFFLLYADTYYLYLNFMVPFLSLSLPFFMNYVRQNLHVQKFVFPSLLLIFIVLNIFTYIRFYRDLGKVSNLDVIVSAIEKTKPAALYGVNDITPALAYITNTPLLNGIVDTNESIYRKKFLNANELSQDAVAQHAMVLTHGFFYPQHGIHEEIIDGIFIEDIISKNCKLVVSSPVNSEGMVNRLHLFTCQ